MSSIDFVLKGYPSSSLSMSTVVNFCYKCVSNKYVRGVSKYRQERLIIIVFAWLLNVNTNNLIYNSSKL